MAAGAAGIIMEEAIRCTLPSIYSGCYSACLCTLPVIAVLGVIVWRNLDYLQVVMASLGHYVGYPFAPFIKGDRD